MSIGWDIMPKIGISVDGQPLQYDTDMSQSMVNCDHSELLCEVYIKNMQQIHHKPITPNQ
jgi:hypothetical protein